MAKRPKPIFAIRITQDPATKQYTATVDGNYAFTRQGDSVRTVLHSVAAMYNAMKEAETNDRPTIQNADYHRASAISYQRKAAGVYVLVEAISGRTSAYGNNFKRVINHQRSAAAFSARAAYHMHMLQRMLHR